ncbi:MAG TPA: hypothetical protein VFX21_06040 [Acidimicrobiia bacterium]|nr:hypothetical protein [Acidimicrobiia bacterium]
MSDANEAREVVQGDTFVRWSKPRSTVIRSLVNPEPRTGIFLKGACDLPALLLLGELLQGQVRGTVAVFADKGAIAYSRADILLQSLEEIPTEATQELFDHLPVPPDYFRPTLFEPSFTPPHRLGEFPKTVVVLSLVPNVIRTAYKDRKHGYLLDPGAWWLDEERFAKGEKERLDWIRKRFTTIGRLKIEEFVELFTKLILTVQERLDAHVLVFNVLTVEPGLRVHNYRMRKAPDGLRRREFNIALAELSGPLGFHIVDVDRTLKRYGISRQQDFDHFPVDAGLPIATEALRILRELEVL